MSMLSISEIRKGKIILFEGEPEQVVSAQFSRQQQRKPVVRSILRNLRSGATKEHTFQQGDKVPEANIVRQPAQFLYSEAEKVVLMSMTTFEQFEVSSKVVGDGAPFLIEGQEVEIMMFDGQALSLQLPIKVDRKVLDAPPGIKGDTSTNVTKEVTIEGGAIIKAPLFIKAGDLIRIDTRTSTYLERAN